MEHWVEEASDARIATNVCVSDFPIDQISDLYKGYIFVGGLFSSQMVWPSGHLELNAGGLPVQKTQWMGSFPHNQAVNPQLNVSVGKTTEFAPTSRLLISQHHNMKWKDVPADGRHFLARCRLSEPMFKTIMTFASTGKTVYSESFENVIILPMPHACEPDDTPLTSSKPRRIQAPIKLNTIAIGHLDLESQKITSISVCEEEVEYPEPGVKDVKSRRWWQRK